MDAVGIDPDIRHGRSRLRLGEVEVEVEERIDVGLDGSVRVAVVVGLSWGLEISQVSHLIEIQQGVVMGRPSVIHLKLAVEGGALASASIGGGHVAGLRTIWLRGRPWPAEIPAPHHTVDDVLDAIDILLEE